MAYRESAPYYDLFVDENDVNYYKTLALQHKSALEIGVGTARVALELAKAGIQVWGIDNSPNMLREAQKKLHEQPKTVQERIRLLKADMTNFSLHRKFPLTYIPSSTIQHCITQDDQIACLTAINKHLTKNGLLAFNLIMPSQTYNSNVRAIGKATHRNTTVMRFISYQPNWQEQQLEVLLLFEVYTNGVMTRRVYDTSNIALIGKREMFLLLERTGFRIENVYGDYNKSMKTESQIVIEARKTWSSKIMT
jgi:SAM-dependent methyltransferase